MRRSARFDEQELLSRLCDFPDYRSDVVQDRTFLVSSNVVEKLCLDCVPDSAYGSAQTHCLLIYLTPPATNNVDNQPTFPVPSRFLHPSQLQSMQSE